MSSAISHTVPVIDVAPLVGIISDSGLKQAAAVAIGAACRETGFFYVANHGIDAGLQAALARLSRQFFDLDHETKMQIAMAKGGRAWRGFFPVGGELTSGQPDLKEGLYFGTELAATHPMVKAGIPLHGANLFLPELAEFKQVVLAYIAAVTRLGHHLMAGLALSLGLDEHYFATHYTGDPLVLFRIFNYPPPPPTSTSQWGVGEHTDYGVLTILKQDDSGGLEVKTKNGWLAAPPVPNTFVCNIGDMLERLTRGLYRSTPHRVKNTSGRARLSYPIFFDPNFQAEVKPLPLVPDLTATYDVRHRWDQTSVHEFSGTYGDYLLGKIGKVFPDLKQKVF